MKQAFSALFGLVICAAFAFPAAAQGTRNPPIGSEDSTIGEGSSRQRYDSARALNRTLEDDIDSLRRGDLDPSSERRLRILEEVKKLDDASGKLIGELKKQDKDFLKETSKLADKIAKSSKTLRGELTPKGKPAKVDPAALSPESDAAAQLKNQAAIMDELVIDVVEMRPASIKKDDAARLEQVCKRLEEIEGKAQGIRDLARGSGK